ncbi:MAG: adaptor protein MecA [Clostridia bacterium]|nr:adaptor protein MecA [Clostridia bacterium]
MKIDMPEKDRLEIRLDERDLSRLNISFEQLDYSNIETRRIVWTLIDVARKELGADFDPTGKMLVEVFKSRDGCKICITSLPRNDKSVTIVAHQIFTPCIFEFGNEDDLIDMSKQIKKLPALYEDGELFRNEDKFRLIVPIPDGHSRLKAMLYEYGVFKGSDEAALSYTREHWSPVITEKALKIIGFSG